MTLSNNEKGCKDYGYWDNPFRRPGLYKMEYKWKVLTKLLATMSNDARGISTPRPASIPKPMKPRYAKMYQGTASGLAILRGKNVRMGTQQYLLLIRQKHRSQAPSFCDVSEHAFDPLGFRSWHFRPWWYEELECTDQRPHE